ncbi:hypothetical protein MCOR29_004789 [Pyricularia oryzae]|nr:hypothetical protein MCOR29_004789 [Pyricularia oryzae]KAI6425496.1 hypothetical protein MCOR21_007203 [Pyricularia oryzae]KAI6526593.1 hypothetical protein MCOR10_004388 [Pyricularia oryzae]KAI6528308.1 hypothetical protein MCOR05_008476 [Pyricularia oryzae]
MVLNSTSRSAFFGQPPKTDRDFNIVRGIYRMAGVNDTLFSPSNGVYYAARVPPNYVHESKQTEIIVGMAVIIFVMLATTGARLIFKLQGYGTRFGMDDWVIIPAVCLAVTYPMLQIYMVVELGAGQHTWENTYEDYSRLAWMLETCTVLFFATVALIKISIALFVRRLAACVCKGWRVALDVFLATLVIYLVAAVLWNVLVCNPTRALWDVEFAGTLRTPPKCGSLVLMSKVLSLVHVFQGVTLLITPVVILWKIPMDVAKKLRLFIIWWFGAVTVTGGLLQQLAPSRSNGDIFYDYTTSLAWTSLDLTMGIITASLPTLDTAISSGWKSFRSRMSSLCEEPKVKTKEISWPKPIPPDLERDAGVPMGRTESTEFILADRGDVLEMHLVRPREGSTTYEFFELYQGDEKRPESAIHRPFR